MTITKELKVDLSAKYPSFVTINSHELNVDSIFLDVSFLENQETITISDGTDEATADVDMVTDGCLIAQGLEAEVFTTKIRINICNRKDNKSVLIRPGKMIVELHIYKDNTVFVPPAFVVIVQEAISDNAEITTESLGTIADCVKEVTAARGEYENLSERLTGFVSDNDIVTYKKVEGAITDASMLDDCTENEVIYLFSAYDDLADLVGGNTQCELRYYHASLHTISYQVLTVVKTQKKFVRTLKNDTWSDFEEVDNNSITVDTEVTDGSNNPVSGGAVYNALNTKLDNKSHSVTRNNLSEELQELVSYYETHRNDYCNYSDKGEITGLDSSEYVAPQTKYAFVATGNLATDLGIDEGTACTMEYDENNQLQIVTVTTFDTIENTEDISTQQKYIRKVYNITPSFKASYWLPVENNSSNSIIVQCDSDKDLSECTDTDKIYSYGAGIKYVNGIQIAPAGGIYYGYVFYVGDAWNVFAINNTWRITADGTVTCFKDTEPKENSNHYISSGAVYDALSTKLDDADNSVKEKNIADNAVTSDKIINNSIGFEKLQADTMIDTSLNAGIAYAFAYDTHIPTTGFIKAINEETKEDLQELISNKAGIETGTVSENHAWYNENYSMTGDYTLIGDTCFLRAACPLISGWGEVYYSLPVAAVSSSSTLGLVGSTIHSINTDTLSNISVLHIKAATGALLSDGTVYFTLCYKYK